MAKHALLEHGGLVKGALVCLICTAVQRSKVQSSESKVQGPPPKLSCWLALIAGRLSL